MKVALEGPINGCTDDEAHGWREAVKSSLAERGHTWWDPMDHDFRGRELEPGVAAEIVELDMAGMSSSDVLLVNAPKPTWGTAMAIYIGWSLGKRVIVVHPEGTVPSPWVVYHASEIRYGSVVEVAETL